MEENRKERNEFSFFLFFVKSRKQEDYYNFIDERKVFKYMRVDNHIILGKDERKEIVEIKVDGKTIQAKKSEMIIAALIANGIRINRYTVKKKEPRGIFCGIGQCTDCVMVVNGKPNVRTCVTPVEDGMIIETQYGVERSNG